jgi:hypothetical protein
MEISPISSSAISPKSLAVYADYRAKLKNRARFFYPKNWPFTFVTGNLPADKPLKQTGGPTADLLPECLAAAHMPTPCGPL